MHVSSAKLTFDIPFSRSLKDKRGVRRSIIDRAGSRFNASIAEVEAQESCQTLVIGIAVVSGSLSHSRDELYKIIRFMETATEAELRDVAID